MLAQPKSVLRALVPFTLHGGLGQPSMFMTKAFVDRPPLIELFLGTLETLPISAPPRIALASAFQRMLEGEPQLQLQHAFDDAEGLARAYLHGVGHGSDPSRVEARSPIAHILLHEVRMAAGYYARCFAPVGAEESSVAAMRHISRIVNMDIPKEEYMAFVEVLQHQEDRDQLTPVEEEVIRELLLLERDLWGEFRFDMRMKNQHRVFCTVTEETLKAGLESYEMMKMPVFQEWGNFKAIEENINNDRWCKVKLGCLPELHNLQLQLPTGEKDSAGEEITRIVTMPNVEEVKVMIAREEKCRLIFNKPLVPRVPEKASADHRAGKKFLEQHEMIFEIPRSDGKTREEELKQAGWMERYFRTRANSY